MPKNHHTGLLWESDRAKTKKEGAGDKPKRSSPAPRATGPVPLPPIPDTGWKRPLFADLSPAKAIAVDVETWDPDLGSHGPGWGRGRGHVVGVAIGTDDGYRAYYPMRHEVSPEQNFRPEDVAHWLNEQLSRDNQPKVGANLLYDLGWLREEGVNVAGDLYDVQYAEALLREDESIALDAIGIRYLGEGKTDERLYNWIRTAYQTRGDPRQDIYRAPPSLVGPYAEGDVDLPLKVLREQWQMMQDEDLLNLWRMECNLIYLYERMRREGVTVDLKRTEELITTYSGQEEEALKRLSEFTNGEPVNVHSARSLAKVFDAVGVGYPRTQKGEPSFTKEFLEACDHSIGGHVRDARLYRNLRVLFLENNIQQAHVGGRVHCEFHPLRGGSGGTRTGRFASSNPNLQNIPSRQDVAKQIRSVFVPDEGHVRWRCYDYSQIEYRFLVHHAVGQSGEEAREAYRRNPDLDYHDFVQALLRDKYGRDLPRKAVKNINFGLLYGMGPQRLADGLEMDLHTAKGLFDTYFEAVPFARETSDAAAVEWHQSGKVTTILNRASRFKHSPHRALNRKLQGSAADLVKAALYRCWNDGVFDRTGVPKILVHDEFDFSDPGDCDDAFREMAHIMETALPVSVPIRVDCEMGPNWGELKEVHDEDIWKG